MAGVVGDERHEELSAEQRGDFVSVCVEGGSPEVLRHFMAAFLSSLPPSRVPPPRFPFLSLPLGLLELISLCCVLCVVSCSGGQWWWAIQAGWQGWPTTNTHKGQPQPTLGKPAELLSVALGTKN